MRINDTEIFLEPAGTELGLSDNEQVYILYSPLTEDLMLIPKEELPQLPDLLTDMIPEKMPSQNDLGKLNEITKLSILPNLTCNFNCSYCYSAKGRSKTEISWEKLQTVLDYFIDENRIKPQHISIFISGGGEPLMSWNTVDKTLRYARERAETKGFRLSMSIVTNGSLITEDIAEEIKRLDCSVCISYEILADLQNLQRKHYDNVKENILMLKRLGVRTMLNSTITPVSVLRMKEMLEEVIATYPFVAQYTMEPVTDTGMFASADELRAFYDNFFFGYIECKKLAEESGINLRFTFDDSLRGITIRHCPGKFALTPQGTISICHLTSSPKEARYERCIYGKVENGKLLLDEEKFEKLRAINVFSYERCRDCFAKWSCGGECLARNETYPENYMQEVCRFNRKFIKHLLLEEIGNTIKEEYGISLEEYVRQ